MLGSCSAAEAVTLMVSVWIFLWAGLSQQLYMYGTAMPSEMIGSVVPILQAMQTRPRNFTDSCKTAQKPSF